LIDRHVPSDDRRFPDDNPHAVVDEQAGADRGARMDFNPGKEADGMRDDPPRKLQMPLPEPMAEAIAPHGMKSRIAEEDLDRPAGRRIAVQDGPDIFAEGSKSCHGILSG
jgi:hypothetical protein